MRQPIVTAAQAQQSVESRAPGSRWGPSGDGLRRGPPTLDGLAQRSLLPVCCPWGHAERGRERPAGVALRMAHETPGDRGFALCLPLTEREPLLSGGLVSSSTMACGSWPVNGPTRRPVDGLGDNPGGAVDGRLIGCGQPGVLLGTTAGTAKFFRGDDLLGTRPGSCGKRNSSSRSRCRCRVRYSPHR